VILASASPRRKQLLAQLGLQNVQIIPSKFAENLSHDLGALNYVLETATAKVLDVYRSEIDNTDQGEPALFIGADTIIVSHDGRILEKPRGAEHHISMLKMLRDQGEHKVMTAVAVMKPLESGWKHMSRRQRSNSTRQVCRALSQHKAELTARSHRRAYPGICTDARRQR
jgi:septum formation protein